MALPYAHLLRSSRTRMLLVPTVDHRTVASLSFSTATPDRLTVYYRVSAGTVLQLITGYKPVPRIVVLQNFYPCVTALIRGKPRSLAYERLLALWQAYFSLRRGGTPTAQGCTNQRSFFSASFLFLIFLPLGLADDVSRGLRFTLQLALKERGS